MLRRRRELTQLSVVFGFAVNDPKKLKDELPKIAPIAPDRPAVEISPYGEVLVNGFVKDWWKEGQKTA